MEWFDWFMKDHNQMMEHWSWGDEMWTERRRIHYAIAAGEKNRRRRKSKRKS